MCTLLYKRKKRQDGLVESEIYPYVPYHDNQLCLQEKTNLLFSPFGVLKKRLLIPQ